MRHELFRLFDVPFPAYFGLLVAGFAFATAVACMMARRTGENPDVIVDLALASLLLGVVGGRVFHVLFDGFFADYVHLCTDPSRVDWRISRGACESEHYQGIWDTAKGVCHPSEIDCFVWAKFWAGGMVYYGGFVFAAVAGILLLQRDRFPLWKGCDLASIGIALGLGFGRIGCLLAGCCFGRIHDHPLSLVFPTRSPASDAQFKAGELASAAELSHPVIPTQPLESLLSFGVALLCLAYVHPRKRYHGQVFVWFLGSYAAGRFALEFLRADDRGAAVGLSTSQWVGAAIVVLAVLLHRWRTAAAAAPVT